MNPYVSLVIVLLVSGALLLLLVVHLMARALIRPPRMTDGKALHVLKRLTPRDVGLTFVAETYEVDDALSPGRKLRLSAWWMPAGGASSAMVTGSARGAADRGVADRAADADRTVVLVHGYADAKVGALAWARPWHDLGFNLLAVDLRAHGDSGGVLCTGGFAERQDLVQAVHQLIARRPDATRQLMLFGASLGAAAVAGAAAMLSPMSATEGNADIGAAGSAGADTAPVVRLAGVVLDSPFADFRSASTAHFALIGLTGGAIARMALRHAERLTGARFADVRPIDLVGKIGCPLLVLSAGEDVYVSPTEAQQMSAAVAARPPAAGPSIYRRFEGVDHLMAVVAEPAAYREAIGDFVAAAT